MRLPGLGDLYFDSKYSGSISAPSPVGFRSAVVTAYYAGSEEAAEIVKQLLPLARAGHMPKEWRSMPLPKDCDECKLLEKAQQFADGWRDIK